MRKSGNWVCIIAALIFTFIFLNSVRYFPILFEDVPPMEIILTAVTCVLFFLLIVFINGILIKHKFPSYFIILLIVAIQVFFLITLRPIPFLDELCASEAAMEMVQTSEMPSLSGYFSFYGNNYPFVIAQFFVCKVLSLFGIIDFWPWLLAFNLLLLDLGFLMFHVLLAEAINSKVAFSFLTILLVNPYTYLCAAYPYTNTWSIFFIASELLLLYRTAHRRSLIYPVLSGIMITLGAAIRVVSLIPVIAIIIIRRFRIPWKALLAISIAVVCTGLLITGIVQYYVPEELTAENLPITHWIMMGFNEKSNGGYWYTDEQMSMATPANERIEKNITVLKERLASIVSEGKTYSFLFGKLNKTWVECWLRIFYIIDNSQNYGRIYSFLAGNNNLLFLGFYQLSLSVLYVGVIIAAVIELMSKKRNRATQIFLLSLIGGVSFHMIWEANGFYSVSFLPFAAMLCACIISEIDSKRGLIGLLCILCSIKPLSYQKMPSNHTGWSVNSDMRREELEYQFEGLDTLTQTFSIKKGFRFNLIQVNVGSQGTFTLYNGNGTELYTERFSNSCWEISFPNVYEEGDYYFTVKAPSVTYRECRGMNYNQYGELLIDGNQINVIRSNLLFNVLMK